MIEKLINDELQSANKKFPLFSSWHAVKAIKELIQVAAMCDKAAMSLGKEKTE